MATLEATLDVGADPVAGRLIHLEGPIGLGWRRWRESERRTRTTTCASCC